MAGAPATEVVTEIAGKDVGAGLFGDPLRPGRHRLVQDRVAPDVDSGPGRVGDSYFRAADGVTLDADRKVRLVAPADRLDPGIEISHPGRMPRPHRNADRSEEHTSELQSLMRISYAVFCLKKKTQTSIK